MKYTHTILAAALLGGAAAKDSRTFSIMRFTNLLTRSRVDPIVSPGEVAQHVHGVVGGSGFHKSATAQDLVNSECTTATVKGDNSAYWFPTLYFQDPSTKKLEPVSYYYASVYYFFDATDDEIKAFPQGLKMVAGDSTTRIVPQTGGTPNLDPSKGAINNVAWTCPRSNGFDPPNWPADSDGSQAGIVNPNNAGEGVGFPVQNCDGLYSPLRADVHFPSCYNPDIGLDNYHENMVFPTDNGNWKVNCPPGYIHVPHLFLEVYWDTPAFASRWTPDGKTQPFVLSNGDLTGYSSHADFFSAWDEDILQNIIDNCNNEHEGMDKCPGVTPNSGQCTIPSEVDEVIDGQLDNLPGDNPLTGWGRDGSVMSTPSTSFNSSAPSLKRNPMHRRHIHLHHKAHGHSI